MAFDEQYTWLSKELALKALKWKRRPGQKYDNHCGSWSARHINLKKLKDSVASSLLCTRFVEHYVDRWFRFYTARIGIPRLLNGCQVPKAYGRVAKKGGLCHQSTSLSARDMGSLKHTIGSRTA